MMNALHLNVIIGYLKQEAQFEYADSYKWGYLWGKIKRDYGAAAVVAGPRPLVAIWTV